MYPSRVPCWNQIAVSTLAMKLSSIPGRVKAQVMRLLDDRIGVRFSSPDVGDLIAGWSRGTSTVNRAATSPSGN